MMKKLVTFALVAFLLTTLPMAVDARSSSSSSSSSSSYRSSPSTTSYSRSSSTPSQSRPITSSSSSNSTSTYGSSYNSSYSSHPITTVVPQAVTSTPPKTSTTMMPSHSIANPTGGRTETKYVTIFSDAGTRTIPVIVPFGYTQPIVLPQTYYPASTTVVNSDGTSTIVGTILAVVIGIFFLVLLVAILF